MRKNSMTKHLFFIFILLLSFAGHSYGDPSKKTQNIGVFAGSFDPFTKAHLTIVNKSIGILKLKRVYIFVNTQGPKVYQESVEDRIQIIKESIPNNLRKKIIIRPITSKKKEEDYQKIPLKKNQQLWHIKGADTFNKYIEKKDLHPTYQRFIVFERAGHIIEREKAKSRGIPIATLRMGDELETYSSTRAREALKTHNRRAIRSLLPKGVPNFIARHHLYCSSTTQ